LNFNTDDYTVLRFLFRCTSGLLQILRFSFHKFLILTVKKIMFVFQHVCASFVLVWVIVCVCVRVNLGVSFRVTFWMISPSFISDDKSICVWMYLCMYVVGTDVCVCAYVYMWMYGGINVCLCVFVCGCVVTKTDKQISL
jgi:hypothetical protein